MAGLHQDGGGLWRRWRQTAARRPRANLLVDAATGRAYRAAEITTAAEMIFNASDFGAPGGCIAWVLPNGLEWLAIFLAAQKAGCAALPLDPGLDARQGRELAVRLGVTHWWDGKSLSSLSSGRRKWKNVAVVKVTSGSTGEPAAVPCAARHLLADGAHIRAGMRLRAGDKNLGLIPFGHSYGLGNLIMPFLMDGLPIIFAGAYTIAQIREWCERCGPTVFPSVPAVFKILAESAGSDRLGRLRLAISAGAPLPAVVAQSFAKRFGRRIHNFYGASETGGVAYDRTGHASLTGRSVGRPLPGVRVILRAGRVVVRGAAVAAARGEFTLADCAQWNAKRELVLTGRVGRLANIAGRKVSPVEIESVLCALPGVTAAWCGVGTRAGRDFLAAAVETTITVSELKRTLAARLPAWKQPRIWLALPQFPRTSRGKTDPRALAAKLGI